MSYCGCQLCFMVLPNSWHCIELGAILSGNILFFRNNGKANDQVCYNIRYLNCFLSAVKPSAKPESKRQETNETAEGMEGSWHVSFTFSFMCSVYLDNGICFVMCSLPSNWAYNLWLWYSFSSLCFWFPFFILPFLWLLLNYASVWQWDCLLSFSCGSFSSVLFCSLCM